MIECAAGLPSLLGSLASGWFSGSAASAASSLSRNSVCSIASGADPAPASSYWRGARSESSSGAGSSGCAGCRVRRRSSFRQRLRVMVSSQVENFAEVR